MVPAGDAVLVVLAAAVAGVLAYVSPAAASVEPGDVAATDTYLTAADAYEQAALANAPASLTAVERLAGTIDAECPGVLKGAPPESPPGSSTSFASEPRERCARCST